jgi:hypothetical protein
MKNHWSAYVIDSLRERFAELVDREMTVVVEMDGGDHLTEVINPSFDGTTWHARPSWKAKRPGLVCGWTVYDEDWNPIFENRLEPWERISLESGSKLELDLEAALNLPEPLPAHKRNVL